jgi:uncharacterized protein YkwD
VRYRAILPVLALTLCATLILIALAPTAGADVDFSDYERQVMMLVNQARWANGQRPPLKANQELTDAARYHSQDMRDDDYFYHDSYNRVGGDLVFERHWDERVQSYYSGYSALGEIIAAGSSTPASVMDLWMQSEDHRDKILSTDYRELGIGYAAGGIWGHYWTQDFGSRSDVYPVVINREVYFTFRRTVFLYVYGQGWATEMRFSNDGTNWSAWEPYSANKTWTLSEGEGTKTVYVEIKNGGGTVRSANDDITFQEPASTIYLPLAVKND